MPRRESFEEWVGEELKYQRQLIYRILASLTKDETLLKEDSEFLKELSGQLQPKLSFIKLAIGGEMPVGPATLTVGDKKTVSVLGFDQNGAPFEIDFTANPVTFTDDNSSVVQDTPGSNVTDPITAVAAGVANIGATCAGFTDTEAVTVVAAAPRLSSVKISID